MLVKLVLPRCSPQNLLLVCNDVCSICRRGQEFRRVVAEKTRAAYAQPDATSLVSPCADELETLGLRADRHKDRFKHATSGFVIASQAIARHVPPAHPSVLELRVEPPFILVKPIQALLLSTLVHTLVPSLPWAQLSYVKLMRLEKYQSRAVARTTDSSFPIQLDTQLPSCLIEKVRLLSAHGLSTSLSLAQAWTPRSTSLAGETLQSCK